MLVEMDPTEASSNHVLLHVPVRTTRPNSELGRLHGREVSGKREPRSTSQPTRATSSGCYISIWVVYASFSIIKSAEVYDGADMTVSIMSVSVHCSKCLWRCGGTSFRHKAALQDQVLPLPQQNWKRSNCARLYSTLSFIRSPPERVQGTLNSANESSIMTQVGKCWNEGSSSSPTN